MRIGYIECFSGISGDMMLGALVDAGVSFEDLSATVRALNVGARLEMCKVSRGGLAATKVDVLTDHEHGHEHAHHSHDAHTHDEHEHEGHTPEEHSHASHTHASHQSEKHSHEPHSHEGDAHAEHTHEGGAVLAEHAHSHDHRSLSTILGIIRSAKLAEPVKERACRAFQMLGEAEAAIHSMPIEKVHFHEVGAVDTIVDIVCAAAGAAALGVDQWIASPLNVGSGTVRCAHGTLPVPAPATLSLLGDAPVYSAGEPMERVTPTGAAILRMLDVQYGSLPAMRIAAFGYGAGGRDTLGQPNLLRLLVGEESAARNAAKDSGGAEQIAILETVIDDSSPQLVAYVSELLLEAGAWDVYRVAVQMKKGRTGVQLTVLCRPDLVSALRDVLLRETTTIGMHWRVENKFSLAREFKEVQTQWGAVRIKIARWQSGETANAAPEYEDCRLLAATNSVPLKNVMQEAMRVFAAQNEEGR
jgi:uncharacterized protein (TIGR00299 family) protein